MEPESPKQGLKTEQTLDKLRDERKRGRAIIVAGVGSGLTARAAMQGGADVLAVYNTAIYRIRGMSTTLAFLPYDNANALTLAAAPEVLANAGGLPVLFGFGAHDPRTPPARLVEYALTNSAAGVTNEPFVGLYGDEIRMQLEAAGLGFARELELLTIAVERGLLALGYAFTPQEARQLAECRVPLIGAMVGVTAGGAAGGMASASPEQSAVQIAAMTQAAKQVNADVFVLGHGGPLSDPASVAEMMKQTGADGYITGSTGERMPVEVGVAEAIRRFKGIQTASQSSATT